MLIAGFIFAEMRYHSYLNSAKKIIESYKGNVPFSFFLKKYFGANKKHGSKDRKQIATLCYNFYRLGKAMPDGLVEEKFFTGTFLCEHTYNHFLHFHKPEWNELIGKPLTEKISFLGFKFENIFPGGNELSDGIDHKQYCLSFFDQPDLFIRIRPGKKNIVLKKLHDAGLKFEMPGEDYIALTNAAKLDTILELDKEVVVQDYNSQKVLDFFKNSFTAFNLPLSVWDCCAASGGKSILAYDIMQGKIDLTVSDIRESILANLTKRFETAGIKNYKSFIADLSINLHPAGQVGFQSPILNFQLIICDTPCTGSGTWSRTPEQLYFFKEKLIAAYADKQKKIVDNIIPHLQTEGLFLYITCSVFKKENEDIADYIKEKFHLQLLQMELLKGYDKKADSMFTAVFIKK